MHTDENDDHGAEWRTWADDQLNRAGWTHEREPVVRYIANQFLGMGVLRTHRNLPEFQQAIDLVYLLIRGTALTDDTGISPSLLNEIMAANPRWTPVLPGQRLDRTARVRVRADAYTEESGNLRHNGREGNVLDVRHGRVIVHYDDDPAGVGSYHDLRLLERKVG